VEFFRNTKIDFLGWKWYFLGFSLIFSIAGILSMFLWHGIPLGVDFKGGAQIQVKFAERPDENQIRSAMDRAGLHNARIQRFGATVNNQELISLEQKEVVANLDQGKEQIQAQIIKALDPNPPEGKQDINNVGMATVQVHLATRDPLHLPPRDYDRIVRQIMDFRNQQKGGVVKSIDDLQGAAQSQVLDALKQDFFASGFSVGATSMVGPQVGAQLRKQALLATLYSLAGMLVYLWFRFEMIYGVAAVVAVFHDTLITIGAFSLTNTDITLTVIAAILTLVGYSMNDTIVVFDRIRENVKMMRRESLAEIVNRSINQTLSRTILTSGLTFLTVLSLYLFGGEVLKGFSFALVVGILIGTYSSIAVAAPMLVAYQDWRSGRSGRGTIGPAAATPVGRGKVGVKV
jgi:preprotein translocase subunit SecF